MFAPQQKPSSRHDFTPVIDHDHAFEEARRASIADYERQNPQHGFAAAAASGNAYGHSSSYSGTRFDTPVPFPPHPSSGSGGSGESRWTQLNHSRVSGGGGRGGTGQRQSFTGRGRGGISSNFAASSVSKSKGKEELKQGKVQAVLRVVPYGSPLKLGVDVGQERRHAFAYVLLPQGRA